MTNFGPLISSAGPATARIMIVAGFPSDTESERRTPFVGHAYYELRRMLNIVGVSLHDCFLTHVFPHQPLSDNLHLYTCPTPTGQYRDLGPLVANPLGFLGSEHRHHLDRLHGEIRNVQPNVIITLGSAASWAFGLGIGLKSIRGSTHTASIPGLSAPVKVIPTFDPATILRQWDLRVIALSDLEKAHVESATPTFSFDNTELWLNPTVEDLEEFNHLHMTHASICACDIETKRGQITAISFAPTPNIALSIPFWLEGPSPNYWPTVQTEAQAWAFVRQWMENPNLTKVFQNGLYDLQYLQHICNPAACTEDTMLLHHSLFSELQKGLGFLGSIYANVPSWKSMRTFKREEIVKREE